MHKLIHMPFIFSQRRCFCVPKEFDDWYCVPTTCSSSLLVHGKASTRQTSTAFSSSSNNRNELLLAYFPSFHHLKFREKHKETIVEYLKEYYKTHIDELKEYKKKYAIINKDKIQEYLKRPESCEKKKQKNKRYYEKHKDDIKLKRSEGITCTCGRVVSHRHMARHKKSKIHIETMGL